MDQTKQKLIDEAKGFIRSAVASGDAFPFVTFNREMWQAILEELEGNVPLRQHLFFQSNQPAPTEYRVLTEWGSADLLFSKVAGLLKEGWRLQGGVSISHSQGNERIFAQAVVR